MAYLFGSRARGASHAASDVDLGILFQGGDAMRALDLAGTLERATRVPVDVIDLEHASPDVIHRVLRDGILLVERDKGRRVRFEVASRAAYLDLLPVLRRIRSARGAA